MAMFEKERLKKKSENLSDWYTDVILKAELADYAPVKGCMVIKPYGYALWEKIQEFLDKLIKDHGVKNAYFPLSIPESFLAKEKEHVKGFSPQIAVVTYAGGKNLKEKLVVRPTSETIMYEMYKRWAHSWRDLPILINQWNNVVRWEKRTYLFLRTTEFLWQEGHCAHYTHKESMETVAWALGAYQKTYRELLAIYGIAGVKSESEKFAGGDKTFTLEILMPDGKALQGCTSHDLGQNFAKAFGWTIQGNDGEKTYPWQNSWGFTTRNIGALVMAHGDDNGLFLPPKIAPVQIVIVPIFKQENTERITKYAKKIKELLNDFRVELDLSEEETVGFKFNKWELKGVPLRLEVGAKEMASNTTTIVRRDTFEKINIKMSELASTIKSLLDDLQKTAFLRHKKFTQDNTHEVNSYEEFKKIMATKKGFLKAFWCENPKCEEKIKEETKASTRCLPLGMPEEDGKCVCCGAVAKHRWLFAQAY
ncbi:MAG: proline--tRNA ligase [bacterium]|nr:proline--tRNA ligase [bacterium]